MKKKRVSLDEYKKRRDGGPIAGSAATTTTAAAESGKKKKSFIPDMQAVQVGLSLLCDSLFLFLSLFHSLSLSFAHLSSWVVS